MKKKFLHINAKNIPRQTGQKMNLNSNVPDMKVQVENIKSWKDNQEHEKVRRQRQDLFDNWEHDAKKYSSAKQNSIY